MVYCSLRLSNGRGEPLSLPPFVSERAVAMLLASPFLSHRSGAVGTRKTRDESVNMGQYGQSGRSGGLGAIVGSSYVKVMRHTPEIARDLQILRLDTTDEVAARGL